MTMLYSEDGRLVKVGSASLDYLSITTYDADQFDAMTFLLSENFGTNVRPETIQRYTGLRYTDGIFMGSGQQPKGAHFMIISSGYDSEKLFRIMRIAPQIKLELWKPTRLDLQCTVPTKARRSSLAKLGDNLRKGVYGEVRDRRSINVRTISSNTGDTVYIGSTSSERMIRLYDKYLVDEQGQKVRHERFEVQFRENTAMRVLQAINQTDSDLYAESKVGVLRGDIRALPQPFVKRTSINKWRVDNEGDKVTRAPDTATETNKTKWLLRLNDAIIGACKQDGVQGIMCRQSIMKALVIACSHDELVDYQAWNLHDEHGELCNIWE